MSSSPSNVTNLFGAIPVGLRQPLLDAYNEILKNFRERRWEPSELNGGKLCEIVYTIVKGQLDGSFHPHPVKPSNMVDACRALENYPSTFSRSLRIQIPRMLMALYEIRNNRGVGHVSAEIDPNHMDASAVLQMSKWLLSELVRIFHGVDTTTATEAIDSIVERTLPIVWEVQGVKRILDHELQMKDKTLLLLYHSRGPVSEPQLVEWLEHSNASIFRRDVLRPLHKLRLIEYDSSSKLVHLSPKGMQRVEVDLLDNT